MSNTHKQNSWLRASKLAVVAMMFLLIAISGVQTLAAQTAVAGSVIGNQASASYLDLQGVSHSVQSNLVQTSVTQVYAGTLSSTQTRYANPGTQVVFPHTYQNTGNGSDTVTLTIPAASISASIVSGSTHIYLDANGDGVPDNTTDISGTSITLAANQIFKFVVVGTLSSTAATPGSYAMNVQAVSTGGGTVTGNPNTDTISATANGAIAVTKAMSVSSGPQGQSVKVTLTYTNTGNATATNVILTDALGTAATQFSYTTGNLATWNGQQLFDNGSGEPSGVTYSTATANTPILTIASVAPGVTGTFTFQMTVGATAPIGGTLTNTATFKYGDGGGNTIGPLNTNTVPFVVQQLAGVKWTGGDATVVANVPPTPSTDALGATTVNRGGTITFKNTLTNGGNGFDTFNITYSGSTFPAGTTFQFLRADGVTPLTDSNGDGIVDSGPIAAGATYTIYVTATLPVGTSLTATAAQVTVTAASTASSAGLAAGYGLTHNMTDSATITTNAATVDVTLGNGGTGAQAGTYSTNGATQAQGKGAGWASSFSAAVNPGTQVIFPFYVQNTSAQAAANSDSYALTVQNITPSGNPISPITAFAGNTTPAGWTAIFHQASGASCPAAYAAQATPVSATNALTGSTYQAANSYALYCLELDIPVNAPPSATNNFVVQAASSATGAVDQMAFVVAVNTLHSVTITPNQANQIYAGGTVAYKHVITNGGNVTETVIVPASNSVVFNPVLTGWTGTIYNSDGTGALDAADTVLAPSATISASLAPGATVTVFLKIQASQSANPGDQTDSTITISYNSGTTAFADDVTTVVAGQVRLVKYQYVDTAGTVAGGPSSCTGGVPVVGSASYVTANAAASRGNCIVYEIIATNTDVANITNVNINDVAPPYTTYVTGSAATTVGANSTTCTGLSAVTPTVSGNQISAAFGAANPMIPGCSASLVFKVQLN